MSDKNDVVIGPQSAKKPRRTFLGVLEQKDFILVILAFFVPLISWSKVIGQMLAGQGLLINVWDLTYQIHMLLPIIIFIFAVMSGSLTGSILISISAVLGYIIVGIPYYWNPAGWLPTEYPPDLSFVLSDTGLLLFNLLIPGVLGGILAQFGIVSAAKNDLKELLRRPFAVILFVAALLGAVLVYVFGRAATLNIARPVTLAYLLMGALAIIAIVSYSTRTGYGGLAVGFVIALVYYSAAAAKDPSSEVLAVFAVGIVNWVRGAGLDLTLQTYYISYGLGFFVAALWGSIWGVLGKFMVFASAPKTTEEITEAHIFRDLWSNYFIFGKNTRPEFRLKDEAGSTVQGGAALTSSIGAPKAKGKYVTYRYLDRKRRFERVPASIGGLLVEPQEAGKCKVYERTYKARGQEDKKYMGDFLDPKPLFDKYKPMWSPFSLGMREYATKALAPFVIIPIILGAIFFARQLIGAGLYILSGAATTVAYWILAAQAIIIVFLIFYLLRWRKKLPIALKAHPEGSLAFLFAGAVIGVLVIFSFYFLASMILVVQSDSIFTFGDFTTNAIIFLLVVTIFTSASTVQILGSDNFNVYFYDDEEKDLKPYKNEYDKPYWLKGSHYWVFRHIYFWPFEMTPSLKGFMHEDYERVEIWVNADTGKPEWSISDYHWRELWYKIPELDEDIAIQASFNKNFHTPSINVIRRSQLKGIKFAKESFVNTWKAIFYYALTSRALNKEAKKPPKVSKKRVESLAKFFVDLPEAIRPAAAGTMAGYPWNFFRFPKGVASVQKAEGIEKYVYREPNYKPPFIEHVTGGTAEAEPNDGMGAPASLDADSPQLCPKCGKPLAKSLVCSSCGTDAKVESFLNVL
ncbi:MAG: hypothetical protein WED05_00255 [Candidatus Atabeyarchaeum deiterrae]